MTPQKKSLVKSSGIKESYFRQCRDQHENRKARRIEAGEPARTEKVVEPGSSVERSRTSGY